MAYWTAIHEIGHTFNLAHAWQKSFGTPQGASGDPWTELANEPEGRSFMNYPFRVNGGQAAFFSDFRFRFSDDELVFLRHAPRSFVQMGSSDWVIGHAFEAPARLVQSDWTLEIRPNREVNTYRFLEPVFVGEGLTRTAAVVNSSRGSTGVAAVEERLLTDGHNLTVAVQRVGGRARLWRPMVIRCHEEVNVGKPSGSLYAAHTLSASPEGWLIDEPGTYLVQGAIDLGEEVVLSNVLRLSVAPPVTADEAALACEYFTEDVARALVFAGAPSLPRAMETLDEVTQRIPGHPAAVHAAVAVSTPRLQAYKVFDADSAVLELRTLEPDPEVAAGMQKEALIEQPHRAVETLGHINYFDALDHLADAVTKSGDAAEAQRIRQASLSTMQENGILPAVMQAAEHKLNGLQ